MYCEGPLSVQCVVTHTYLCLVEDTPSIVRTSHCQLAIHAEVCSCYEVGSWRQVERVTQGTPQCRLVKLVMGWHCHGV